MELTFKDLKRRDVKNITDGACLGRITDINLTFPTGRFLGIFVPGKKRPFFCNIFSKNDIYIEEYKIIKIGNDVILVNLSANRNPPPPPKPEHCNKPPTCEKLFGENLDDEY